MTSAIASAVSVIDSHRADSLDWSVQGIDDSGLPVTSGSDGGTLCAPSMALPGLVSILFTRTTAPQPAAPRTPNDPSLPNER